MINPLSEQLKKHNGSGAFNYTDCYDDREDREALKCWLTLGEDYNYGADKFRRFIVEEFNLPAAIDKIVDDPLGEYKVDLGLYSYNKGLMGLIEVDHYTQWNPNWPLNYRYCHALARKTKYWNTNESKDLPYISCTFNMIRNKMIVSTKKNQLDYMHTMKQKECLINGKKEWDWVIEIPLPVAKKFGDFSDDELRRVS